MPPTKKNIPIEDIKGLKTLRSEGLNDSEIEQYYKDLKIKGLNFDRVTIGRRLKELGLR